MQFSMQWPRQESLRRWLLSNDLKWGEEVSWAGICERREVRRPGGEMVRLALWNVLTVLHVYYINQTSMLGSK